MFLLQVKLDKTLSLDKVSVHGNRLLGFISSRDEDSASTLWGSARSSATITELPRTPSATRSIPQLPISGFNGHSDEIPSSSGYHQRDVLPNQDPPLREIHHQLPKVQERVIPKIKRWTEVPLKVRENQRKRKERRKLNTSTSPSFFQEDRL